jgi:signal transduction histidine kinase
LNGPREQSQIESDKPESIKVVMRRATARGYKRRNYVPAATRSLARRETQFSVNLPAGPISLDADPLRLAQILSNLLINAAKYSNPGGHIVVQAPASGRHPIHIGERRWPWALSPVGGRMMTAGARWRQDSIIT